MRIRVLLYYYRPYHDALADIMEAGFVVAAFEQRGNCVCYRQDIFMCRYPMVTARIAMPWTGSWSQKAFEALECAQALDA
jgi:hypothetical protein